MEVTLAVRAPKQITRRIFVVISDHIARSTNCHYLDRWIDLPSRRRARGQNRGAFAGSLWHRERGFDARPDDRRYHQIGIPGQGVAQAAADDRRRRVGPDPRRRWPGCTRIQRRACFSQGTFGPREEDPADERSDHASFQARGYPASLASEDFFAGPGLDASEPEGNPNYHKREDTFVDAVYTADIARSLGAAAWAVATDVLIISPGSFSRAALPN
jgi:hypothetical protein